MMPIYEATAEIDAPWEAAWRVLSTVHAWPDWLPTVTRVEALDGSDLAIGRRFVVHQPQLRPTVWTVTEVRSPNSFTWQARSPGLVLSASHTLQRNAAGRVQATLRFSFQGMLGPVVGWLFRTLTQRYLAQEAAALKQRSEQA